MGDREPEGAFEGDVSAGDAAVDSADSEESRKMKRVDDSKEMLPDIHISFDKQSSNKVRASEKMTIVKKPLQETETTEKGSSEDVLKGAEEKGYIKERAVPTGVPVVGSLGQGMDAANNKEEPAPLKALDTKKTKPEGTMTMPDVAAAAVAGRKPEERKEQGAREEGIVRKGTEVKQDQDEGKEAKPQVADIRGLAPLAGVPMAAAAVVPKQDKPDSTKKVAEPTEGGLAKSVKRQETKQKAGIPEKAAAAVAVVATAENKPQGKQEKGAQEEGTGPKDTKAPGAVGKETVAPGRPLKEGIGARAIPMGVATVGTAGRAGKPESGDRKEVGSEGKPGCSQKDPGVFGKELAPQGVDTKGPTALAGAPVVAAVVEPKKGKPDSGQKGTVLAEGAVAKVVKPQGTEEDAGTAEKAAPVASAPAFGVAIAGKKPKGTKEKGGVEEGAISKDTKAPGTVGKEAVPQGTAQKGQSQLAGVPLVVAAAAVPKDRESKRGKEEQAPMEAAVEKAVKQQETEKKAGIEGKGAPVAAAVVAGGATAEKKPEWKEEKDVQGEAAEPEVTKTPGAAGKESMASGSLQKEGIKAKAVPVGAKTAATVQRDGKPVSVGKKEVAREGAAGENLVSPGALEKNAATQGADRKGPFPLGGVPLVAATGMPKEEELQAGKKKAVSTDAVKGVKEEGDGAKDARTVGAAGKEGVAPGGSRKEGIETRAVPVAMAGAEAVGKDGKPQVADKREFLRAGASVAAAPAVPKAIKLERGTKEVETTGTAVAKDGKPDAAKKKAVVAEKTAPVATAAVAGVAVGGRKPEGKRAKDMKEGAVLKDSKAAETRVKGVALEGSKKEGIDAKAAPGSVAVAGAVGKEKKLESGDKFGGSKEWGAPERACAAGAVGDELKMRNAGKKEISGLGTAPVVVATAVTKEGPESGRKDGACSGAPITKDGKPQVAERKSGIAEKGGAAATTGVGAVGPGRRSDVTKDKSAKDAAAAPRPSKASGMSAKDTIPQGAKKGSIEARGVPAGVAAVGAVGKDVNPEVGGKKATKGEWKGSESVMAPGSSAKKGKAQGVDEKGIPPLVAAPVVVGAAVIAKGKEETLKEAVPTKPAVGKDRKPQGSEKKTGLAEKAAPVAATAAVVGAVAASESRKSKGKKEELFSSKPTKPPVTAAREVTPHGAKMKQGIESRVGPAGTITLGAAGKDGRTESRKKGAAPGELRSSEDLKGTATKEAADKRGIVGKSSGPAAVGAVAKSTKPDGGKKQGTRGESTVPGSAKPAPSTTKEGKLAGAGKQEGDRKRGTPKPSGGPVIAQQSGAFVQEVTAVPAGAAVVEAMDKNSLPEHAVATKAKPESTEGISASKAGDTTASSAVALDGKPQNVEGIYGAAAMGGEGVVEDVARSMEPKEGASKLGHEDTIMPSKPALDSANTGPNPEEGEALLPKKARPATGGFGLGLGTIRSFFMGGWGSVKQRTGDDVAESAGKAVEGETSPKQISEAIEEEDLVQQGGTAVGSKEVSTGSVPIMGTVDDVADSSGAPSPIDVASGEGKTLKPAAVEVLSATTRELPISTVKSVDSESASRGKGAPMSIGGSGEIREVVPEGSASRSLRVTEVSPAAPVAMSKSIARDPSSGERAMRGLSGPAEETAVEERRVAHKTAQRIGKKASGGVMGVIAFVFGEPDDATDGDDLGVGTSNFEKKQTWLWHSS